MKAGAHPAGGRGRCRRAAAVLTAAAALAGLVGAGTVGAESLKPDPNDVRVATGPWGTLQSYFVHIAAPDSILELFPLPSAATTWDFVGLRTDEVRRLLDRPDIPAEARAELLDTTRWTILADTIQLTPSPATVLAIPPEDRAAIYDVLARWEANEFHHSPWFVPGNDVDNWLEGSGLRPALVEAVRRTSYRLGRAECFSDVSLLMAMATSDAEARHTIKALSRCRTAILRLALDDSEALGQIASYWGAGPANAKDFMPLLESIATNPAVRHLDVVHVLPPYARKLLYTYPHPSLAVGGQFPDCHWTTLNFFNYRPEGRLFDTDGATMRVLEGYERVAGPPVFGDILFLTNDQGHAIHSCVHLADGFVFTKNGSNVISPWLVMQLEEVRDRYSRAGEPAVEIYRKRP
jgi:hypothetical protein